MMEWVLGSWALGFGQKQSPSATAVPDSVQLPNLPMPNILSL